MKALFSFLGRGIRQRLTSKMDVGDLNDLSNRFDLQYKVVESFDVMCQTIAEAEKRGAWPT